MQVGNRVRVGGSVNPKGGDSPSLSKPNASTRQQFSKGVPNVSVKRGSGLGKVGFSKIRKFTSDVVTNLTKNDLEDLEKINSFFVSLEGVPADKIPPKLVSSKIQLSNLKKMTNEQIGTLKEIVSDKINSFIEQESSVKVKDFINDETDIEILGNLKNFLAGDTDVVLPDIISDNIACVRSRKQKKSLLDLVKTKLEVEAKVKKLKVYVQNELDDDYRDIMKESIAESIKTIRSAPNEADKLITIFKNEFEKFINTSEEKAEALSSPKEASHDESEKSVESSQLETAVKSESEKSTHINIVKDSNDDIEANGNQLSESDAISSTTIETPATLNDKFEALEKLLEDKTVEDLRELQTHMDMNILVFSRIKNEDDEDKAIKDVIVTIINHVGDVQNKSEVEEARILTDIRSFMVEKIKGYIDLIIAKKEVKAFNKIRLRPYFVYNK